MKKENIIKSLEWTDSELKEIQQKKKDKANKLLLKLINSGDEEGAIILISDKTLEVNADMHQNDYTPLSLAIGKNLFKLVKENYLNPDIKNKFNLNRKKIDKITAEISKSNNPEMYDFLEQFKEDKLKMVMDTLFISLGLGNLNLIKHLIDKKIENEYSAVDLQRAQSGYRSIFYNDKLNGLESMYEYTSYFFDIENKTKNNYINEFSKKTFFNSNLLDSIIFFNDTASLKLYRNLNDDNQLVKDFLSVFKENEKIDMIKEDKIKWFLLKTLDVDFSVNNSLMKKIENHENINKIFKSIKLNEKLENDLTFRNQKEKKPKI